MANISVNANAGRTSISVQDGNNLTANIQGGNNITAQITPVPTQIVQINRGVQGPSGNDNIGGYPVAITSAQNYDALMFLSNQWVNINQTEISDGGNF
jgi:hypothetical protein